MRVLSTIPLAFLTATRDTRVAKLDAPDGPYAALILAKAGMVRFGMGDRLTADLSPPNFYYAVSQVAAWQDAHGGCPWAFCAYIQMHGKSDDPADPTCPEYDVFISSGLGTLSSKSSSENKHIPC